MNDSVSRLTADVLLGVRAERPNVSLEEQRSRLDAIVRLLLPISPLAGRPLAITIH